MPTVMLAKQLETVTAIGYGEDVNGATQNAVESALAQVVGSFIDAENFIKQKTEIQNAVSKTSKTISSSFSSYSQGSVESLTVIDVVDSGSMKKVTASVTIRVEDFKRYIREVAMGEAKVTEGLFAKTKVKQSQGANLVELVVDKVLAPARNYEAADIKVGEVSLVDEAKIERAVASAKIDFEDKTLVRIPVTVGIRQDFLDNAYKVLDETSADRFKGSQIQSINISEKKYDYEDTFFLLMFADVVHDCSGSFEIFGASSGRLYSLFSRAGLTAGGYVNPGQARLYALPESHFIALNRRIEDRKVETGTLGFVIKPPNVNLRILNSIGDTVFEDFISPVGRSKSVKRNLQSFSSLIAGEGFHNYMNNPAAESVTTIFTKNIPGGKSKNTVVLIDLVKRFDIITALSDEVLEVADSIQVELRY